MKSENDVNPSPHTGTPSSTLTPSLCSHVSREPRGVFVLLGGWASWRSLSLMTFASSRQYTLPGHQARILAPSGSTRLLPASLERERTMKTTCTQRSSVLRVWFLPRKHFTQMFTGHFNIPIQNVTCEPHSIFS